jgi:HEAT repeat protein
MKQILCGAVVLLAPMVAAADEVSDLTKKLRQGDVEARRTAAKALGDQGEAAKEAVPALTEALKDNDRFVRRFAAQALGEIGPSAKSAAAALSAIVRDGRDKKEVLDAAAAALGKIGATGPTAVNALAVTLRDTSRDPESRRQAAEALGKLGASAKPAISALVDVLKPAKGPPATGAGDLRTEAAIALGEIATPEDKPAVDALTALSTDRMIRRDRTLMKAVNDALKKIQAKKAQES